MTSDEGAFGDLDVDDLGPEASSPASQESQDASDELSPVEEDDEEAPRSSTRSRLLKESLVKDDEDWSALHQRNLEQVDASDDDDEDERDDRDDARIAPPDASEEDETEAEDKPKRRRGRPPKRAKITVDSRD